MLVRELDELFQGQALILWYVVMIDVLAFDLGAFIGDQVTEMPNGDGVERRQVEPELMGAEVIGLRLVLELGLDLRGVDTKKLGLIGVDLTIV